MLLLLLMMMSTLSTAPIVIIHPASGMVTVGQPYSLTCSVMVVPHLVVQPTIQWTKNDGATVNTSSASDSSLQLNFDHLKLSDGGMYTCTASIESNITTFVSNVKSRDVIVMSKLLYLFHFS